ncbi:tetratricopeptide repeat protein [Rhodopirellula bahusiensis]|uniref:tetratricopeptide repeat protein n=1 Tax=Rhodopirellula bahusiensis TaxID=2014065 RepID=UPI0032653B57
MKRLLKTCLAFLATAIGCSKTSTEYITSDGFAISDPNPADSEFSAAIHAEDYRTAEIIGRNSTELDPDQAYGWIQLSIASMQLRKHDQAIASCERAIEIDPSNAYYYYHRGLISQQQGDHLHGQERTHDAFDCFGTAIDAFQTALEMEPELAEALFGLAASYEGLGLDDKAIRYAEMFLATRPESPKAKDAQDIISVARGYLEQDGG